MKAWKYSFILLLFIVTACGQKIESNMSEEVQPFNFTTQDQEQLSKEDLKGQWWVANTIFTSCETVCPPMTRNMSILQEKVNKEELEVQLVSFSIDPETDTPSKLKEYGNKFGADYSNWTFLTGYDFQTIKEFSIKSFKSLVDEVPDSDQYMHGTSFFLVNPEGEVIKKYKGTSEEEMQKIVEDLKKVM